MGKYRSAPVATDKMPGGIPFIVSNEAAERFSFYGMKTILIVFMTKYLLDHAGNYDLMGPEEAKGWYHTFTSAVYFFPILGALISDVFLGKYKTILTLSMVYCAGHAALAIDDTRWGLAIGLTLIAVGSGGIKPCVSAHVGDQFGKSNQGLLEKVFQWFYFSINLGAFLSTLATPWLLDVWGPHLAFGVPGILMAIATFVFWLGRNRFVHIPPQGLKFVEETFSKEGLVAIGKLFIIYVFIAVFWALYDQTGSAWVLQADTMNLWVGPVEVLASQVQAINPVLILAYIPLFSFLVFPLVNRFWELTPLRRIAIGLFLTAPPFVLTAMIESWIAAGELPSVLWHVIAYAILTAAEVLVSITALEFSYTQAPKKMKSFVMATFLLSVSIGNLFTAGVNFFIQNPTPGFVPDVPGTYELTLTASDGTQSTTETLKVDVVDQLPPEQPLDPNEQRPVEINGLRLTATQPGERVRVFSTVDPGTYEGTITRSWKLVDKPESSKLTNADIQDDYTLTPALVPDVAGTYRLVLTVEADGAVTGTAEIHATTDNLAPIVEVGAGRAITGKLVELDGGSSYDPHGDALAFAWEVTSVPAGSTVTTASLQGSEFATATSVLSGAAYYYFFAGLMLITAFLFIPVAWLYKTRTYIQDEDEEARAEAVS